MVARRFYLLFVLLGMFCSASTCNSQQPLVLRDLSLVRNDPIVSFDRSGVVLQSQRSVRWSKILRGSVAPEQQSQFDKYLVEVGLPLFRLESRIKNRDWAGMTEIVEPMFASVEAETEPNMQTQFLICVAAMRSRIYNGRRLSAVEPYLRAALIASENSFAQDDRELQNLSAEVAGSVSPDLLPVCFDRSRAMGDFVKLNRAVADGKIKRSPTALVYLAAFSISSENYGVADQLLAEAAGTVTRSTDAVSYDWLTLIEAHRKFVSGDVGQGRKLILNVFENATIDAQRAFAFYLLGAYCDLETKETQLLNLLVVPALYGKSFPDLSAAALYQAVTIAKDKSDSKQVGILLNELLRTYPNTYHGRLAAIKQNP